MYNKFKALLFAAVLSIALPSIAFADDADSSKILMTENMAIEMSQSFVDSCAADRNLTAHSPVKLYDTNGQAIGYIVSYRDASGASSGYVIFDNARPELVSEYTFEENAVSPYDYALGEINSIATMSVDAYGHTVEAVKIEPMVYAAVDANTGEAVDMYGDNMKAPMDVSAIAARRSSTPNSSSWDTVFIDNAWTSYDFISMNTIPEFIAVDESTAKAACSRYACSVQALLHCSIYYLGQPSLWTNCATEYIDIWNATETYTSSSANGITYGSTYVNRIGPGFVNYCAARNCYINQVSVPSPSYSQFTSNIDSGNVSVFSAGILIDGARSGHSMTVEGYAKLRLKSTASSDYAYSLLVADGWFASGRFVNFYYAGYTDTYGTFFSR